MRERFYCIHGLVDEPWREKGGRCFRDDYSRTDMKDTGQLRRNSVHNQGHYEKRQVLEKKRHSCLALKACLEVTL